MEAATVEAPTIETPTMGPPTAPATFTLFASLPIELRHKIWKHTLPPPRRLWYWMPERFHTTDSRSPSPYPVATQVNQESRAVALRDYTLHDLQMWSTVTSGYSHWHYQYLDFANDIFGYESFATEREDSIVMRYPWTKEELGKIRRMVVHGEKRNEGNWSHHRVEIISKVKRVIMNGLENLDEVIVEMHFPQALWEDKGLEPPTDEELSDHQKTLQSYFVEMATAKTKEGYLMKAPELVVQKCGRGDCRAGRCGTMRRLMHCRRAQALYRARIKQRTRREEQANRTVEGSALVGRPSTSVQETGRSDAGASTL
jgi:hypothetical protein